MTTEGSPPLLAARGVSLSFAGRSQPAVANVSLDVHAGDAIGIVGESGSGKTTLGRLLVGALHPTSGTVTVKGRSWSSVHRKDPLRRRVQMIFQDPYSSLNPWQTARQTVAEVLTVWDGLDRRASRRRAAELLDEVGLSADAIDRRPSALSGGQCQRVGIARALACAPEVIVADEPTSALDVSVQAQILNLLDDLRSSRAIALVLISHDLGVVRHATDRSMVMLAGAVVEDEPTEQVFSAPEHEYTRRLLDSVPGWLSEPR